MKKYEVVAGVIVKNKQFFCAQRKSNNLLSGKWEFPGGKIEAGESREDALVRELNEELSINIKVNKHIITVEHQYPDFHIVLHAFLCTIIDGEPVLNEHQNSCWLDPNDFDQLNWAEADIPIYKKIQECYEVYNEYYQ